MNVFRNMSGVELDRDWDGVQLIRAPPSVMAELASDDPPPVHVEPRG